MQNTKEILYYLSKINYKKFSLSHSFSYSLEKEEEGEKEYQYKR